MEWGMPYAKIHLLLVWNSDFTGSLLFSWPNLVVLAQGSRGREGSGHSGADSFTDTVPGSSNTGQAERLMGNKAHIPLLGPGTASAIWKWWCPSGLEYLGQSWAEAPNFVRWQCSPTQATVFLFYLPLGPPVHHHSPSPRLVALDLRCQSLQF